MPALFSQDQFTATLSRSPLGIAWLTALVEDPEASRLAVAILADAGLDPVADWTPRRLLGAIHACLHRYPSPLGQYTRTLGPGRAIDAEFLSHMRELLTTRTDVLVPDVARTTPKNDPAQGADLLDLAAEFDTRPEIVLFLGAAAGLELVGDMRVPRFPGVPRRATDLAPLDVHDDTVAYALLGGCFVDDPATHERMKAGIAAARAQDVTVESVDASAAVRELAVGIPAVVCASTLLCSVDDAPALVRLIAARPGPTLFVSREAVAVHRAAGHGDGLEGYEPSDCLVQATLWNNGTVVDRRSRQVDW